MMKQQLNIHATEPSAPKADVVMSDELRKEIERRRMLGRIWIVICLVWWLGTVIPIVYVVSSAGPCTSRSLPQWLIGKC
ncbi:MAG: hypothetical protein ACI9XZ_004676 [Alphaproteobacteria bacterium]|jgi:hypothetical protein